jgi:WD40 repeat protein
MFVFGNYKSGAKHDKIKRPASVWNLETGKQIAAFDQKRIRYARWSTNGKTLVIANEELAKTPRLQPPASIEVSFWDGESFQHLNTLHVENLNWSYLTKDGRKFFYTTAKVRNLILFKVLNFSGGPINIWDIEKGNVEQVIAANPSDLEQGMRSISVSPDERFLTFVTQPLKSKDTERTLVVWSIDKTRPIYEMNRRYEIKPTPKISEFGASFSPDGKYLALITAKGHYGPYGKGIFVQIYTADAGAKLAEFTERIAPGNWFNGNQILLFNYGRQMKAVELATGKQFYEAKIIYEAYQETTTSTVDSMSFPGTSDITTHYGPWVIIDETKIVPHPNDRMFLTYSKEYVKVYDAKTGAVLQTLVEPPIDISKPVDPGKKPRLKRGPLVSKADWYNAGNAVYVVSADKKTVSFWSMN